MKGTIVFKILAAVFFIAGLFFVYNHFTSDSEKVFSTSLLMAISQFTMAVGMLIFVRAIDKQNNKK